MTNKIAKIVTEEQMAELNQGMAVESGFTKIQLPKIGLYTQDKWEGKGKTAKVIAEAGVYYIEEASDEQDEETGKMIWNKSEILKIF